MSATSSGASATTIVMKAKAKATPTAATGSAAAADDDNDDGDVDARASATTAQHAGATRQAAGLVAAGPGNELARSMMLPAPMGWTPTMLRNHEATVASVCDTVAVQLR